MFNMFTKVALTLIIVVFSFATVPAFAGPTVKLSNNILKFSYRNAGEFTAAPKDWDWDPIPLYDSKALYNSIFGYGFQTFCVEASEYVFPGLTYKVEINSYATYGGKASHEDPISEGTAWLYYNFAKGILTGYEYSMGQSRINDASKLQAAIWYLEEETLPSGWSTNLWGPGNNEYLDLAIEEFGCLENAKSDYRGTLVAVMNLTSSYCYFDQAQDQLVLIPSPPLPPPSIPAPAAVLLGSIGAGLVGWLRRRRMM